MASTLARVASIVLALAPQVAQGQEGTTERALPTDPLVTVGELENGLRYFVRANGRPEDRAELRLVVNAGSVLEDDDQQGLAHFVEHMAFNGTERFPKHDIVHYLESIGMQFGADVNAYTSFDETVYQLTVPTDTAGVLETAFDILEDWAQRVAFEPDEIERERGVVIEEWRLRRGATARIQDQQFPVLFKGSRYAERLPIGKPEILETFEYPALHRFYDTWYRPDLMAVIAVGDFDATVVEGLIREHFGGIPRPEAPLARPTFSVPPNDAPLVAIATDPEETTSSVSVYYKHPAVTTTTERDLRRLVIERLYSGMLNARLFEIGERPDAPFLYARTGQGGIVRAQDAYFLGAVVPEGGILGGLDALLTEADRVAQFGFTASELARQKERMLRSMEQAYAERGKTNSSVYASRYVMAFLEDYPFPGIEYEYPFYERVLPGITLDEVNDLVRELITDDNRVVLASAPTREPAVVPDQAAVLAVFDRVRDRDITPYEDRVADAPLVAATPKPADVVTETYYERLGVTDWMLSNGVRVLLKPTDFKDDEIVVRAWSPGGTSLADDDAFTAAMTASDIVSNSGVGAFSLVDLQKVMTGKAVSVFPLIDDVSEGVTAYASPKDVVELFQLIYLYFTAPRVDSTAFLAYEQRMREFLRNRAASPQVAMQDTVSALLTNHHYRARPFTEDRFAELDLQRSYDFYRDRFADASDFTFVIVGNINVDSVRQLVREYLGGLPAEWRRETWRDVGMRPMSGVVERDVYKGLEPQSRTSLFFTGFFAPSREEAYALQSMTQVLDIWMREILREDLSGTYGASVAASTRQIPDSSYTVSIGFGSAPERAKELVSTTFHLIDSLQVVGPSADDLARVKEIQRREREIVLRQNRFWAGQLAARTRLGLPLNGILDYDDLVSGLTADAVKRAAHYLRRDNYILVTLYPENTQPVP
jgi:zinc protease